MKKIVIIFFVSYGLSQQIQFIPFDWSGQFGYVNKNGAIMWNQDWQSGRLLFDGTWSVYPKMYGNEIEEGFINQSPDTSNFDSSLVKSYFKYDQGDYSLDRFSLGTNYTGNGRQIHFHAFKRSFYGAYGQYNNQSNQPIQQSYLGSYESQKGKEHAGISVGHFNTYSGIADSTARGLIDNRITAINTFWNQSFGQFNSKVNFDQFMQRYVINHSLSSYKGVRYLTRSRIIGELYWKDNITIGAEKNMRSTRMDTLKIADWNRLYIKSQLSLFDIDLGVTSLNDSRNIDYNIGMNYQLKSFLINVGIEQLVKPIHPYYLFQNYSENIDLISVTSNYHAGIDWDGELSNASIIFSHLTDNNDYWDIIIPDSGNYFEKKAEHDRLNLNYQTSMIPFIDLEINYATRNTGNIYGGGIGSFLNYNIKSRLSLFDGFMLVDLKLGMDRYFNRLNNSIIHPIEMVPMTIYTDEKLDDISLINGTITAYVSTFTIKYEWLNITEMILAYIGSEEDNYFEIHPEMPLLGRQTNLSVEWDFLD
ncbi:uncharacterized protein METZ01_LOCUS28215 [marine metagenome]|uniref:TonB-dependent receptor-like beta-barrel domain-containing protein n=1 Tax=marine metagenome TaxID=408172 RepID=A0A381Q7S5_9ZZZZ